MQLSGLQIVYMVTFAAFIQVTSCIFVDILPDI